MTTKAQTIAADRDAAIEELRALLPVGSTVRTHVEHVSKSGMTRDISAYVAALDDTGKPYIRNITYLVARATGGKISPRNAGVRVGGCGMDMTFALVYGLSRTLYPAGHNCTGVQNGYGRCPSNDHVNDYGHYCRLYDAAHENPSVLKESREDWSAYVAARQDWIKAQPAYDTARVHSDGGYALNNSGL